MKRYIKASSVYNYKVVSWDDTYEEDVHYFATYTEALQYGNSYYNGRCNIIEI